MLIIKIYIFSYASQKEENTMKCTTALKQVHMMRHDETQLDYKNGPRWTPETDLL